MGMMAINLILVTDRLSARDAKKVQCVSIIHEPSRASVRDDLDDVELDS